MLRHHTKHYRKSDYEIKVYSMKSIFYERISMFEPV